MELIYAYISNYRNIEKTELSFSSSHHVTYKDSKLYIKYEELPFSEILFKKNNITSIHLIVGKTGSGKTNLLSLIGMSNEERDEDFRCNQSRYFLLYHIKENDYLIELAGYLFHTNGEIQKTGTTPAFTRSLCTVKDNKLSVLSKNCKIQPWIVTLDTIHLPNQQTDSDILQQPMRYSIHCSIFNSSKYLLWKYVEQYLKIISSKADDTSRLEKKLYCNVSVRSSLFSMSETVVSSSRDIFLFQLRNIYAEYLLNFLNPSRKAGIRLPFQNDTPLERLWNALSSKNTNQYPMLTFRTYQDTCSLFKQLPESLYKANTLSWESGTFSPDISEIIDKLMIQLQIWISNQDSGIANTFEITYKNLSSGEMQFAALFANIEQILTLSKELSKAPILLIDEPETYMHPELCRKFMYYLTQLCKNIGQNNGQFIITSHSPFLLSDLPSQCTTLISFNSYTGKCLVNSIAHQTFGGNIHQLLVDGFFLTNTIGELSYETLKPISEFFYSLYGKKLKQERYTEDEKKRLQTYLELLPYIGDSVIKRRLEELGNFIAKD